MAELDDEIEGTDFEATFGRIAKSTGKTYANREDRDKRLRSERKAGRTAKQRERMAVPKKLVNFRASVETRALLKKLAHHFGEDQTAVILRAIDQLAGGVPGLQERKQWPEQLRSRLAPSSWPLLPMSRSSPPVVTEPRTPG